VDAFQQLLGYNSDLSQFTETQDQQTGRRQAQRNNQLTAMLCVCLGILFRHIKSISRSKISCKSLREKERKTFFNDHSVIVFFLLVMNRFRFSCLQVAIE